MSIILPKKRSFGKKCICFNINATKKTFKLYSVKKKIGAVICISFSSNCSGFTLQSFARKNLYVLMRLQGKRIFASIRQPFIYKSLLSFLILIYFAVKDYAKAKHLLLQHGYKMQ